MSKRPYPIDSSSMGNLNIEKHHPSLLNQLLYNSVIPAGDREAIGSGFCHPSYYHPSLLAMANEASNSVGGFSTFQEIDEALLALPTSLGSLFMPPLLFPCRNPSSNLNPSPSPSPNPIPIPNPSLSSSCNLNPNPSPSPQRLQEIWEHAKAERDLGIERPDLQSMCWVASEEIPTNAWHGGGFLLNPGGAQSDAAINRDKLQSSDQTSIYTSTTSYSAGGNAGMAQIGKQRLRWTPELHARFIEAVDELGGPEKATPKCVLKLMDVAGLQLSHVKSHLQKYRITKGIPDCQEARAEKKRTVDSLEHDGALDTSIVMQMTESLRIQMEMQKQLHEQLEVQRKLQLRIEEQGKHLQKIFEEKHKIDPSCKRQCVVSSDLTQLELEFNFPPKLGT